MEGKEMGPTDILQPSPPKVGDESATAGKPLTVDEIQKELDKVKQQQQMPKGYGR
jgi:hypothetical protein